MNRRFLVVVHAGDHSLHPQWLAAAPGRQWDLVVVHDGAATAATTVPADVLQLQRPGPRWAALAGLLAETRDAWAAYEYVWLPADDVQIAGADIDRLFQIAAGLQLGLAHPAMIDGADHVLALPNDGFTLRFSSFVGTAAPLFSRALLDKALPTLADAEPGGGQRWPRLLDDAARQCAIVDSVVVRRSQQAAAQRPAKVAPLRLCFGGYDRDGRLHHLFGAEGEAFLARLQAGYTMLPAALLTPVLDEHRIARAGTLTAAAPAPAAADGNRITIGTSIAPGSEAKQQRAVASWLALGFDVVSFNIRAEIEQLATRYPEVRFVEVTRDGRERTGKPLVCVDDMFAWFRNSGQRHGGFVNSDIVLQPADPAGFLAALRANIDGGLCFARRVEVQSLDRLEGDYYYPGFDAWFWDRCVLGAFEQATEFYVGFPHWDYYAILMPLLHGFPIRQFAFPVAFHQTHTMYYDVVRDGIPYGLKTFKIVAPLMNKIPAQNHQIVPVLQYFLNHQPGAMKQPAEVEYYHAMLHALDLWFLDVIDRNSEKIRRAEGVAADQDGTSVPFFPQPRLQTAVPAAATVAAPVHTLRPAAAPVLSVIIPTFNRAGILERCLQQLAAQTLPADRFEVIVVDDGSADHTAEVLARAAAQIAVVHERQANLGPAAARNRGLQRARGEWVLFLNDDALLEPRALEIHLEEHARRGPRAAVLGSFPMHPDFTPANTPIGHCMDHSDLIFEYLRMVPDHAYDHHHFYTCNLSVAREFVLRHGGFDEGFVRMGAEDIELGLRLQLDGNQVFYRPDCVARHAHKLDAPGLARMFQFRGRGGVHLFVREPRKVPHYAQMPAERIDTLQALNTRLTAQLARLDAAIARLDGLRFVATGRQDVALDERSSGIDLRNLWLWPDADIERLVETLVNNLQRHADRFAGDSAPSLEEAAGRIYPALQFVKWWHDTLGVIGSAEIRGYLASRQGAVARLAA